jgi:hypothetical protein
MAYKDEDHVFCDDDDNDSWPTGRYQYSTPKQALIIIRITRRITRRSINIQLLATLMELLRDPPNHNWCDDSDSKMFAYRDTSVAALQLHYNVTKTVWSTSCQRIDYI